MNNYKIVLISLVFLLCSLRNFGQDVHFSTIMANDMFLNPAKTAFFSTDFKLGACYRNQWQTIASNGYNTSLLTAEAKLFSSRIYRHSFGIGIGFTQDVAGALKFGQNQYFVSFAYNKQLTKRNEQFISIGANLSRTTWGYNPANADFGQLPTDHEGIYMQKISTFDLSLGLHWQMNPTDETNVSLGFAVFHLNTPSYSFYDESNIKLSRRYTAYATYLYPTSEQTYLQSIIRYSQQNDNYEFVGGLEFIYSLSMTVFDNENIGIGLYFRSNDALITTLRYQRNNFSAGLGYDMNLSGLSAVSNTYGAVELWLNYGINTFKYKQKTKTIPCPTF